MIRREMRIPARGVFVGYFIIVLYVVMIGNIISVFGYIIDYADKKTTRESDKAPASRIVSLL